VNDAQPRFSPRYVKLVVALLTGAVFVEFFHRQVLALAMKAIGDDLHASDTQLGSLVTVFAVAYALSAPLLGRLADRLPRRTIYAAGIAAWSAATALGGWAAGFTTFLATRVLAGAGQGSAGATNSPLIVDYVAPDQRGGVMGIVTMGATLGALGAGALGFAGALEAFGWRQLFLGSAVFGFGFAALFAALVKEPPRGWSEGRTHVPTSPVPLRDVARVAAERPALLHSLIGTVLNSLAIFASAQWIVAFFERVHGMSNASASFALVAAALASTLGAIAGGVLANRAWGANPRAVLFVPAVCSALACPALFFGASTSDATLAVLFYSLAGGLSLVHSAAAAVAMQGMIPDRMRGLVSGLIASIVTLVGLGCGPLIAGALSDWFGSASDPTSIGRALAWVSVLYVWAGVHLAVASRTLKADLELNARGA
jgi:predicted MFS family arabinose efflux permease